MKLKELIIRLRDISSNIDESNSSLSNLYMETLGTILHEANSVQNNIEAELEELDYIISELEKESKS